MAIKEELSVTVGMLRSETQAMEARHTSRLQLVENEVVILQGKIKDKDTNGGRDLFIVKKGFGSLPLFDGRVEKYDDWRFKVITFLEMEDNFRELLEWTETLTTMPEQKDLDAWEFEQKNRNAFLMNDQLYIILCLNLKDEALTMVKNMKTKTGVNGVACWWKFNHDCKALTGQRIQALANAIYKPHRVKKNSEVVVAIEKWERDISRFEAATGKIAEETKTFSLRQLVPDELDLLITSNSNTLKTYEQFKAYANEHVALGRDKKVSGPVPMDALADKIIAVAQGEGSEGTSNGWTWPEEGCTGASRQGNGPGDGHCATSGTSSLHFADDVTEDPGKLADKLEEIMSFVSNLKGKGEDGKSKGKGKGGKKEMCSAGIVGSLVMWQPSVGRRMLRWNSTGPRRARGLGVSPAGKEKATFGGHGKERTVLTRPIARRRTMIEHGHFRWRPEQLRTAVIFCPKSGRHHQVCHHPS